MTFLETFNFDIGIDSSIDVFAMQNPALCGMVLWYFSKGYLKSAQTGYEYPLLYLPIPLVLSKSIADTFKGTNKNTGFFEWISRNPEFPVTIPQVVSGTIKISIRAIHFALSSSLISLDYNNLVVPLSNQLQKKTLLSNEIETIYKNAILFGTWLGKINSSRPILQGLGLKL